MPIKLPGFSRKQSADLNEQTSPVHQDQRPYSLYTHPMPTEQSSGSSQSPYGSAISATAASSVRGSTSTIPSSAGPRTPPPTGAARPHQVFDQVIFEPPSPAYMKSAPSPDEAPSYKLFGSPELPFGSSDNLVLSPAVPSAAAFVTTRRRNSRQEFVNFPGHERQNSGVGSSPGLLAAYSDDELLPSDSRHRHNGTGGYATSAQNTPSDLRRGMSALDLSSDYEDDGELSDSSYVESNRRSENALMAKGAKLLGTGTQAGGEPESPVAHLELPTEAVAYMQQKEEHVPPVLNSDKRVMTVSEFERYRRAQTESPALVADDDEDSVEAEEDDRNGYFASSDSDAEKRQELLKLKQKQDANLAVYRQQMRKVTGQSAPLPLSTSSTPLPTSVNFNTSPQLSQDNDEEEDEIPLGILQAHGLPGRHRGRQGLSRPNSVFPTQQAQMLPPYPRGLTLPEQLHDQSLDMQQPQVQTRGLIHEIAREQEAKLQRRTMLNMHINAAPNPHEPRSVSPFQRGQMSYSPQPPQAHYPPQQPFYPQAYAPYQQPYQPYQQPYQPQGYAPPPAGQGYDPSGISPDLQVQMQKFLGLQMQMMQQMLQGNAAPVQAPADPPARAASPVGSVRGQAQPHAPQPSANGNPARYRTLSTQQSFSNLNHQFELPHATPAAESTVRMVDGEKELAPALPIGPSMLSASQGGVNDASDDADVETGDSEEQEWERLRRKKSTLRKAWRERRSAAVNVDGEKTSAIVT